MLTLLSFILDSAFGSGTGWRDIASLCSVAVTEPYKLDTEFLLTKTNGIFCESMRLELAYCAKPP